MYGAISEEFGVKIPFTRFEMDVLRFLNVAPTQIRTNNWAFTRGFEILCKALELIPSAGAFFHFYGSKGVGKGTWVSFIGMLASNCFLLMLQILRRTGE